MTARRARGFSLIEVLVALVIIGVGMLGLAKIQGLAYASTGSASQRSLAAMQAAGLVSSMRANHAYWSAAATTSTAFSLTFSGATVTASTDGAFTGSYVCTYSGANAPCATALMAAYDVNAWLASLTYLPFPTGGIVCPVVTAGQAVACTITVDWLERTTGINTQSASGTAVKKTGPSYSVIVVP